MSSYYCTVFYTTVSDLGQAQDLSQKILTSKSAACVNIFEKMHSFYLWEQEIQQASEVSLLIKTSNIQADRLQAFLLQHHPYQVPALLRWDAQTTDAFKAYLDGELIK
ncbi:MAG: hypothetical protein BGO07_03360 [Alphaproteobacteria bacterium 40-19]|nr:MAG: hypothetical protein BGO07_03360 [Alphaproteobacteria bacterium 40-19]